ncbi:MAG: FkbM family methyltransferase [Alphaproteobacteria bacterium]
MLSDDDIQDRIALRQLFEKRETNPTTKEGFFYFENSRYMIVSEKETFVVVSRDMAVGYPLFMAGEFEFHKFVTATTLIKERRGESISVLWDIGANIGYICIPAVRRNYVEKAFAFEPEPQLHKLLRANIVLNEAEQRISTFRTALGRGHAKGVLTISDGNTGDYRILGRSFESDAMGEQSRRHQEIDIAPLDHFCDHFEVGKTLLWVDVQGYEGFVLAGGEKILKAAPPLVCEFWPYGLRRSDSFPIFKDVVCSGLYNAFVDLSDPALAFQGLSKNELDRRYDAAGDDPNESTDLLFI